MRTPIFKKHAAMCPAFHNLQKEKECVCDGYHTFNELYEHRHTLFIALCKRITKESDLLRHGLSPVWRAKLHSDGSEYEGWFILGIFKEKGKQITYHLPMEKWEQTYFADDLGRAPEFDGHSPYDILKRIKMLS